MSEVDLLPADATVVRSLDRDQRLFSQGDLAAGIYRIEAGAVRLERHTFDGRLVTVHTARAGELLAEASLFSDVYHCDARAVEPARARLYPKAALLRALNDDPSRAYVLTRAMARQIQALRLRVELRNVRSAQDRVLLFLEYKAAAGSHSVAVDHPLQDMAADLGLNRETFYRTLAALERKGLIERGPGEILLLKPPT